MMFTHLVVVEVGSQALSDELSGQASSGSVPIVTSISSLKCNRRYHQSCPANRCHRRYRRRSSGRPIRIRAVDLHRGCDDTADGYGKARRVDPRCRQDTVFRHVQRGDSCAHRIERQPRQHAPTVGPVRERSTAAAR